MELPGVGENLQDQPNLTLGYAGKINITGYVPYATFATAQDFFGANTSKVAASTKSKLPEWAEKLAAKSGVLGAVSLEKILQIQHDLIFEKNVTVAEILTTASGSTFVSAFWTLLPFSRGGVHLRSTSPQDINNPVIDPSFFEIDFDLQLETTIGRVAQELWATEPIKGLIAENIIPGDSVLPQNASDAQWGSFIKTGCKS